MPGKVMPKYSVKPIQCRSVNGHYGNIVIWRGAGHNLCFSQNCIFCRWSCPNISMAETVRCDTNMNLSFTLCSWVYCRISSALRGHFHNRHVHCNHIFLILTLHARQCFVFNMIVVSWINSFCEPNQETDNTN